MTVVAKPMLGSDWDRAKHKYPCIGMPKIDGVRGLNFTGTLVGRSLKTHASRHITATYSKPEFIGVDGELTTDYITSPTLCSTTSGDCSRIVGEPNVLWNVFDYFSGEAANETYLARLMLLDAWYSELPDDLKNLVSLVPWKWIANEEELLAFDDDNLMLGYEGSVTRDPEGKLKQGRSTVKEQGFLRIKTMIDGEARVTAIREGNKNGNVAQTNELGNTFRTSHKESMIPNGMLGSMAATMLKDVLDPQTKKVLLKKGQVITVSPGKMTNAEAKAYWEKPETIVGHVSKFKFFPKGHKDKPRFPIHQSLRAASDIGPDTD